MSSFRPPYLPASPKYWSDVLPGDLYREFFHKSTFIVISNPTIGDFNMVSWFVFDVDRSKIVLENCKVTSEINNTATFYHRNQTHGNDA